MSRQSSRIQFRPGLVPSAAAFVAIALTLYLATWQQGRAGEKRTLQATYDKRAGDPPLALTPGARDAAGLHYRRATANGEWLPDAQIYVDNKIDATGKVGYHVFTPLRLDGTEAKPVYVLANRGWVARGPRYPLPPAVPPLSGAARAEGMIVLPNAKFLELKADTVVGNVWQNLTLDRYAAATKLDVLPFVLLLSSTDAGLVAVTERPDARVEKHMEYMMTWYSLAATVAALWIGLNLRIKQRASPTDS
jgi:surfeit locus 1 family protein